MAERKKRKRKKKFSPISKHKIKFTGKPKTYWDRLGRKISLGDQIVYMDENYVDHVAIITISMYDGTLYAAKVKSITMTSPKDNEESFTTEYGDGSICIMRKTFALEEIPDKGSIMILKKMDYYNGYFYCKIW